MDKPGQQPINVYCAYTELISESADSEYSNLTGITTESSTFTRVSPILAMASEVSNYPIGMHRANLFASTPRFLANNVISSLKQRIRELEFENLQLKNREGGAIKIRCIEVIELPYAEIKQKVLDYYNSHKEAYPSDIANELGLDLEEVFKAVDELEEEGEIRANVEAE